MTDRNFKPDSGTDLVLEDAGSTDRLRITDGGTTILYDEGGDVALTISTSGNVTLAGEATIDGLRVGQGGGNIVSNTALGANALTANTTGTANTACGVDSAQNVSDGYSNTGMGYRSIYSTGSGFQNVGCGANSLYINSSGDNNVAVGYVALYNVTTGDNNIGIGAQAGRSTSPSGTISSSSDIICLGDNSIANLYCADTTISSSDERDKTEIEDFTHGLDWINQMRPVTYKWDRRSWYLGEDEEDINAVVRNGTKKKNKINLGLIAQEVMTIESADGYAQDRDSQLIANENEDGKSFGIKYDRIVPILINAVKELSAKVTALENG